MTQLHYGHQNVRLAAEEDLAQLRARIELKVRERGGWIDVETVDGPMSLLISAGIPIFLVHLEEH